MIRARSLLSSTTAASSTSPPSSTWPSSSSSSLSSSRPAAHLHTSARRSARHAAEPRNHYDTLDVSRTASAKDIKAQFYKLSKQYHPDINPDDTSAHRKYQAVTEAYATIGNEGNRRAYDRTLASSSSASGMPYASGATYSHDPSDNANRRARATYAWSYARRDPRSRGARSSGASGSGTGGATAGAGMHARAGGAAGMGGGGGGAGSAFAGDSDGMSTFERLAAAERRRAMKANAARAAAAASSGASAAEAAAAASGNADEHNAHSASPLGRFMQVAGLFLATYWVGTKMAAGAAPLTRVDRRIRTEEERREGWEARTPVVVVVEEV